jgi:DNA-binding transcriptional MerR regulator
MSQTLFPDLPAAAPGELGVRAQKSSTAFRTISEVADDLDVAQHVLRFWESKFAQIRPLKRGGGRRYYRPEDVDLLRQIRSLLYDEGYTIKGAQKLLRARRARPGQSADSALGPTAVPRAPAERPSPRVTSQDAKQQLAELRRELVEIKELLAEARRAAD